MAGLLCDDRLWRHQADHLVDLVDPLIVDVTKGASVSEMARLLLGVAPEPFSLAGLSMSGYVTPEVMRAAPACVEHLALLDTSARSDTSEQTGARREMIELSRKGRFEEAPRGLLPRLVHPGRVDDERLLSVVFGMAEAAGPEASAPGGGDKWAPGQPWRPGGHRLETSARTTQRIGGASAGGNAAARTGIVSI